MIIYFSGTGNSRYIAETMGSLLDDEMKDAFPEMKEKTGGRFFSEKPYVFVCPVYAWQMPHIFTEYIRNSAFEGSEKAYFVITCGSDVGACGMYNKKLCSEKGFEYMGTGQVVMPENYIAVFKAPDEKEAARITAAGAETGTVISTYIGRERKLPEQGMNVLDIIKSGIVNSVFYRFIVKSRKFRTNEKCTGCGRCENLCVLNNIEVKDAKVSWGSACTHCMACIGGCPDEAIEYGKHTEGLRRYYLQYVAKDGR